MKKLLTIVTITALLLMVSSATAFAINRESTYTPTHWQFDAQAEGCAGCHVIHTADVAKLLKFGTTQTSFCINCHGDFSSSPYDVDSGRIMGNDGSTISASMAGGFAIKPASPGLWDGAAYQPVTSRHDIEAMSGVNTSVYARTAIPASINADASWNFGSNFKCASCHDPHAGDANNDRLLRDSIPGWVTGEASSVGGVIDFVYDGNTLLTSDYASSSGAAANINKYCGLCHGLFNAGDDGAKDGFKAKYRHAMGVSVNYVGPGYSTTLPIGNKQANNNAGSNQVLCLTCHYPHGTYKASVADDYDDYAVDGGITYHGSVLLRMDKRGVCYDCHGAATKNTEAQGQALE